MPSVIQQHLEFTRCIYSFMNKMVFDDEPSIGMPLPAVVSVTLIDLWTHNLG